MNFSKQPFSLAISLSLVFLVWILAFSIFNYSQIKQSRETAQENLLTKSIEALHKKRSALQEDFKKTVELCHQEMQQVLKTGGKSQNTQCQAFYFETITSLPKTLINNSAKTRQLKKASKRDFRRPLARKLAMKRLGLDEWLQSSHTVLASSSRLDDKTRGLSSLLLPWIQQVLEVQLLGSSFAQKQFASLKSLFNQEPSKTVGSVQSIYFESLGAHLLWSNELNQQLELGVLDSIINTRVVFLWHHQITQHFIDKLGSGQNSSVLAHSFSNQSQMEEKFAKTECIPVEGNSDLFWYKGLQNRLLMKVKTEFLPSHWMVLEIPVKNKYRTIQRSHSLLLAILLAIVLWQLYLARVFYSYCYQTLFKTSSQGNNWFQIQEVQDRDSILSRLEESQTQMSVHINELQDLYKRLQDNEDPVALAQDYCESLAINQNCEALSFGIFQGPLSQKAQEYFLLCKEDHFLEDDKFYEKLSSRLEDSTELNVQDIIDPDFPETPLTIVYKSHSPGNVSFLLILANHQVPISPSRILGHSQQVMRLFQLHNSKQTLKEFQLGAQIHQLSHSLIPKIESESRLKIDVYEIEAKGLSGDFLDIHYDPGKTLTLIIADVAGKGLGPALLGQEAQACFRSHLENSKPDPAQLLQACNKQLATRDTGSLFLTCFILSIDLENYSLLYASAGHNQMIHLSSKSEHEYLNAKGVPLGLIDGGVWENKELDLREEDEIILYTDGIVELEDPSQELLGLENFVKFCQEKVTHENWIEELEKVLQAHRKDADLSDDCTVLRLRIGVNSCD